MERKISPVSKIFLAIIFLILYVDDISLANNDLGLLSKAKKFLS